MSVFISVSVADSTSRLNIDEQEVVCITQQSSTFDSHEVEVTWDELPELIQQLTDLLQERQS